MHFEYKDRKLERLCIERNTATRKLGPVCAARLLIRLQEIEAAVVVTDLIAGHPHPLDGDRDGQFALDLLDGKRLVFIAQNDPCPVIEGGNIDWSKVDVVCIVYIGNYHE